MSIGHIAPAEGRTYHDPDTGRTIRQWTSAAANSYPLYYFIPSIPPENDLLVLHSERSGWVQLYKLDLATGELTQLTDGRTRDAGWAIWCEPRLRGIYNHLSALNGARREVYYFQDEEVRTTHLDTLDNRRVLSLPGRISIGQSGFSPDGTQFAFIHADREQFNQAIADRESIHNMGRPFDHESWRDGVPAVVGLIDTTTGQYRDVLRLDFHVHHVFFLSNTRLLINHVHGENGMLSVNLDGSDLRTLRPRNNQGAVCHQIATDRGIYYEANAWENGRRRVWFGRYDLATDAYDEILLPNVGYVHTGNDPAGRFLFFENHDSENHVGERHQLLTLHHPRDPAARELRLLRTLPPIGRGQRFHAHPFLGPARRWLYYTEVIDGFAQVCALDVADLVDRNEYWDAPPVSM